MPDPGEDFGAGLENPTSLPTQPVQQPPSQADFMSEFRTRVSGVPDDWDEQTLVQNLVQLQTQAEEAEKLRQRIAAYEAQQAAAAIQQQPKPNAPETAAERKRRYEPVEIDQRTRDYVMPDENGGWQPKNPASALHQAAAQDWNRFYGVGQSITNDLVRNPYEWTEETTRPLFQQYDTKFEEFRTKQEERIAALEAAYQRQQQIETTNDFSYKHADKLFQKDGAMTPLGNNVHLLLESGKFTPEEALAQAEKMLGPAAKPAAPTAQPPKVQFKPNRFVDDVNDRQRQAGQPPANRQTFDQGSGRWRRTWEDVHEIVQSQHGTEN